mgnify:CR=1 FL=1
MFPAMNVDRPELPSDSGADAHGQVELETAASRLRLASPSSSATRPNGLTAITDTSRAEARIHEPQRRRLPCQHRPW